jgi:hypothetical protein
MDYREGWFNSLSNRRELDNPALGNFETGRSQNERKIDVEASIRTEYCSDDLRFG